MSEIEKIELESLRREYKKHHDETVRFCLANGIDMKPRELHEATRTRCNAYLDRKVEIGLREMNRNWRKGGAA